MSACIAVARGTGFGLDVVSGDAVLVSWGKDTRSQDNYLVRQVFYQRSSKEHVF